MDVTSNLTPVMNTRGFYVVMNKDGGEIPAALADQVWTSEREANFSIKAYLELPKKETTKEKV